MVNCEINVYCFILVFCAIAKCINGQMLIEVKFVLLFLLVRPILYLHFVNAQMPVNVIC